MECPFSLGNELGSGTFGSVYLTRSISGELIVAKKLNYDISSNLREFPAMEIEILNRIKSDYIIPSDGICLSRDDKKLVLTMGVGIGDITPRIKTFTDLGQFIDVIRDIARGIAALHTEFIIHGDIKTENVLDIGNESGVHIYKLIDFGFSNIFDSESNDINGFIGTHIYNAPECTYLHYLINNRTTLSQASDAWAFGVILLDMAILTDEPFPYILADDDWQNRATTRAQMINKPDKQYELIESYLINDFASMTDDEKTKLLWRKIDNPIFENSAVKSMFIELLLGLFQKKYLERTNIITNGKTPIGVSNIFESRFFKYNNINLESRIGPIVTSIDYSFPYPYNSEFISLNELARTLIDFIHIIDLHGVISINIFFRTYVYMAILINNKQRDHIFSQRQMLIPFMATVLCIMYMEENISSIAERVFAYIDRYGMLHNTVISTPFNNIAPIMQAILTNNQLNFSAFDLLMKNNYNMISFIKMALIMDDYIKMENAVFDSNPEFDYQGMLSVEDLFEYISDLYTKIKDGKKLKNEDLRNITEIPEWIIDILNDNHYIFNPMEMAFD